MTDQKNSPQLISPHGGYQELQSYRMSEIVYDATKVFCDRFIDSRSRTHDQMVQVARSGKQNIAEGSMASPPETAVNTMICLIHQTNYLLDQQLRSLEKDFLKEGGFTERLYRTRSEMRNWRKKS
jgi:restriction system protein